MVRSSSLPTMSANPKSRHNASLNPRKQTTQHTSKSPQCAPPNKKLSRAGPVTSTSILNNPIHSRTPEISRCRRLIRTPRLPGYYPPHPATAAQSPVHGQLFGQTLINLPPLMDTIRHHPVPLHLAQPPSQLLPTNMRWNETYLQPGGLMCYGQTPLAPLACWRPPYTQTTQLPQNSIPFMSTPFFSPTYPPPALPPLHTSHLTHPVYPKAGWKTWP